MNQVNICYYPTTSIFIDDHLPFLKSLPMVVDEDISFKHFCSPKNALEFVNERTSKNPMENNDCVVLGTGYKNYDDGIQVQIHIDDIPKKVVDRYRFLEPSVLVVDYAMPEMNGLDFCRSIRNPNIKKILLTGVAEEAVAVDALNNKVIDYYIKKSSPDVCSQINALIRTFQHDYFTSLSKLICGALKTSCHFIGDSKFISYFVSLLKDYQFVEYYFEKDKHLLGLSWSFLLVTGTGRPYRLSIYTEELIAQHIDICVDAGAPDKLVDSLSARQIVPEFPTPDGFYNQSVTDWRSHVHPAVKIEGEQNYYSHLALLPSISINGQNIDSASLFSYQQHLLSYDA